ncbi:MAG: hypothetical protein Ta2F_07580 [Termitinemataceae bacterium]|nr:MAG: hypothetical protein Ta2F_07580 [Termitinemataceae bacterium]
MSRFSNCEALVLRLRSTGEANREAFFLTSDAGIIRSTVYGGAKSKLRAFVSQFHSGILYLYHDPVRNSYKVQDFDVKNWRPLLRESFERSMTALAISETILASFGGGGNWQESLKIATASLDVLETADDDEAKRIFVHFLWGWAEFLGIQPDTNKIYVEGTDAAALRWLKVTSAVEPPLLSRYAIDKISLEFAKNFCTRLLANNLGSYLKSWNW